MNWRPTEKQFLIDNYEKMTQREIARELRRSHGTISHWVQLLGLTKPNTKRQPKGNRQPRVFDKPLAWEKGKHLQDVWK